MIFLYSLRALLWQRAMRVFSISSPITKGLKFIPWAMPNLRLRIFTNHFIFTDVSEQKGIFKKTYQSKLLKKELICKGVFCGKIRQPKGKTFHSRKKFKLLQKAWDFKDFVVQKGEKYYANVKVYSLHKMALWYLHHASVYFLNSKEQKWCRNSKAIWHNDRPPAQCKAPCARSQWYQSCQSLLEEAWIFR